MDHRASASRDQLVRPAAACRRRRRQHGVQLTRAVVQPPGPRRPLAAELSFAADHGRAGCGRGPRLCGWMNRKAATGSDLPFNVIGSTGSMLTRAAISMRLLAAGRDPDRRGDASADAGRRRRRAGRADVAEGQGGAGRSLPVACRPHRRGLRPPPGRADGRPRDGAAAAAGRLRPGRSRPLVSAVHRPRRRRRR